MGQPAAVHPQVLGLTCGRWSRVKVEMGVRVEWDEVGRPEQLVEAH